MISSYELSCFANVPIPKAPARWIMSVIQIMFDKFAQAPGFYWVCNHIRCNMNYSVLQNQSSAKKYDKELIVKFS